jgi:hypothetical protein
MLQLRSRRLVLGAHATFVTLAFAMWALAGCADTPLERSDAEPGTASAGDASTEAGTNDAATANPIVSPPPATDPGPGRAVPSPDTCAETSMTAPPASNPQIDIVWVVDSSSSMSDEQMKIAANLLQFADRVSMASVDVHIVMLTNTAGLSCPEVLPPDPLAKSPLSSDPRYLFVDTRINSTNALDRASATFAMYSQFLRPGAVTHFVIVTDDESHYKGQPTPEARAARFQMDMQTLLGKSFILHSISSPGPDPCRDPACVQRPNTPTCQFPDGCGAAAPGLTYYALARLTNGLTASICESDWTGIFKPLSDAVIASAPLPCNYQIPAPPKGETLDSNKVNVRWRAPASTDDILFPRAAGESTCGVERGWYYDVASKPTQVLLCPASCKAIAVGGTLSIGFGCATIVLN